MSSNNLGREMNKSLIDFITKLSLCGILVLIFVVLFNIIKDPYAIQPKGYQSDPSDVKEALYEKQVKDRELDKDFMDTYVDDLNSPDTVNVSRDRKLHYYVPLPKEYSIVN